jgi:lipid-A-disaccharide synthase-like uncharacterized protein
MIRRVTYDLFIIFHDALSKITKFTVPGTFWYSGTVPGTLVLVLYVILFDTV